MLITFQIVLIIMMLFLGLGLLANDQQIRKEDKLNFTAVILASIVAFTISLFV